MKRTLAISSLALMPGFAAADVTPQDVWENLTASYGALGFAVDGTPTADGDALVASDVDLVVTLPLGAGTARLDLPEMTLTPQGDGTVAITSPKTYAMDVMTDALGDVEQVIGTMTVSQSGEPSIASGDPGDISYVSDVAQFDVLFTYLNTMDVDAGFTLEIDSDGFAQTVRIQEAADGTVELAIASLGRDAATSLTMDFGDTSQSSTTNGGELLMNIAAVLPPNMDILNLTPALLAGLSVSGDIASEGSSSTSTSLSNGDVTSTQSQTIGASTSTFAMDQSGFRVSGTVDNFTAEIMDQTMLPFPVAFSGENGTANFAFPLVASDTAQDFTYAFTLAGLKVADDLWNMIDPGQSLNRGPADLGIDVQGSLNWGLNVFDLAMYEALGVTGDVPISINSVDIRNISLAALGAMAKATGDFTFDNDDMQTIPGIPRPEGEAIIEASGINAAIDQLLAAGLLSDADIGPARMMMGLFTRVTGDDSFETTVEVNPEGHVIVNGQRMR